MLGLGCNGAPSQFAGQVFRTTGEGNKLYGLFERCFRVFYEHKSTEQHEIRLAFFFLHASPWRGTFEM